MSKHALRVDRPLHVWKDPDRGCWCWHCMCWPAFIPVQGTGHTQAEALDNATDHLRSDHVHLSRSIGSPVSTVDNDIPRNLTLLPRPRAAADAGSNNGIDRLERTAA